MVSRPALLISVVALGAASLARPSGYEYMNSLSARDHHQHMTHLSYKQLRPFIATPIQPDAQPERRYYDDSVYERSYTPEVYYRRSDFIGNDGYMLAERDYDDDVFERTFDDFGSEFAAREFDYDLLEREEGIPSTPDSPGFPSSSNSASAPASPAVPESQGPPPPAGGDQSQALAGSQTPPSEPPASPPPPASEQPHNSSTSGHMSTHATNSTTSAIPADGKPAAAKSGIEAFFNKLKKDATKIVNTSLFFI